MKECGKIMRCLGEDFTDEYIEDRILQIDTSDPYKDPYTDPYDPNSNPMIRILYYKSTLRVKGRSRLESSRT